MGKQYWIILIIGVIIATVYIELFLKPETLYNIKYYFLYSIGLVFGQIIAIFGYNKEVKSDDKKRTD